MRLETSSRHTTVWVAIQLSSALISIQFFLRQFRWSCVAEAAHCFCRGFPIMAPESSHCYGLSVLPRPLTYVSTVLLLLSEISVRKVKGTCGEFGICLRTRRGMAASVNSSPLMELGSNASRIKLWAAVDFAFP